MIGPRAGWLDDLTNWIRGLIEKLWEAIEAFFTDLIVAALEKMLELVALAFESLPVPSFMTQHSIGSLLGNAGPTVGWYVETFKISECPLRKDAAVCEVDNRQAHTASCGGFARPVSGGVGARHSHAASGRR